jgi:hypothetical protein
VLERPLEKPKRVEVLHLGFRSQRLLTGGPHRHVGVAAQAPLFHVAVVDAEPDQQPPQTGEEPGGRSRRPQVRLGDDLDERYTRAVEIDVGLARGIDEPFVQRLAGVFFEMDARDSHALEPPRGRERQFVL